MTLEKKKKLSPKLQLIIRFLVSGGLILYLFNMIDWKEAIEAMKGGSFLYIAAAFIAIQITVSSSVAKWYMLVHPSHNKINKRDISIHKLGRLYYVGLFFNNFLPGSVGGDVVRVVELGKQTGLARATASVALERITSGLALVVIVIISSLFMEDARTYLWSLFFLFAFVVILLLLLKLWLRDSETKGAQKGKLAHLINKVKSVIIQFGETISNYRDEGWKWWGLVAILSILFQAGMAWINDLLFMSFGIDVSWLDLLVIITLISVITMIPVSLNGLGVREVSYVFFFQKLGIPDEISISVSLLFFFLVSISSIVGGLFWLVEKRVVK